MRKHLYLVFILLAVMACKQRHRKENIPIVETAPGKPEVKLYALDGGTVMVNNLDLFSQGGKYEGRTMEFADAFYIIEHPKGRLMWDAGLSENLVGQEPFTTPNGNFTVSRKDSLQTQLATLGLSEKDIDYLALSHTHFDHSGSAYQLTEATWLVPLAEYAFVHSEMVANRAPDNLKAVEMLTKTEKFEGDLDVFGDGSVIIKAMPGHTPGHTVLFVDLVNHGPVLLSGDLYHFQENRDNKGVPSFNTDVEQTLKSMEAFEAFAKEKKAAVIIQHEAKHFAEMPKAPKYLN
jgi:glyoxylase-like metal-dependent hydrolase (beta-lactamase superfamily II)